MLVKSVGRLTARASTSFTAQCGYSTPSLSRPITYEEAKEKVKMGNQFGLFGMKSGVDIRKLWPTVEEIEEINQMHLHRTAREAAQIAEAAKQEKIQKTIDREKQIEEKLNE